MAVGGCGGRCRSHPASGFHRSLRLSRLEAWQIRSHSRDASEGWFIAVGDVTKVKIELSFDTVEEMDKMIARGFEKGFTMGLNNLEELLSR